MSENSYINKLINLCISKHMELVMQDFLDITGSGSVGSSPHRAVRQPACVTLLVSAVVGGQELLGRGHLSTDPPTGLFGQLEGEGVTAGRIAVMEHYP